MFEREIALDTRTVEARLSGLFDRISKGMATKPETMKDLRELSLAVSDPYRSEKLGNAIGWAKIYFSRRQWEPWQSRERIRDFLLDDLYKARIASPFAD